MKKQREEEGDRISQLPEPILHHILCYLSQKHAVQTCVLSKSWRHLGPTRPKIEFREEFFNGNEEGMYLSVLDKTLQRYHDQKLSIQVFIIVGMKKCSESLDLLEKWIPVVVQNFGVNIFRLVIDSANNFIEPGSLTKSFKLPSSVLSKAKFLKELIIDMSCQIDPLVDDNVLSCKHLRKLRLRKVYITDATLEKITSSCSLLEDLSMNLCEGLQTIKLTKAPNLKFFNFCSRWDHREGECGSIEIIDAPSIESITIAFCPNWIQNYFPRLKFLCLHKVRLSNESIEKFSTNLPCLEKLTLSFCFFDFEQFKLSSRSIKHLTVRVGGSSVKAVIIDATNILCFRFSCLFLPSVSFTTTSTEWKSIVRVGPTSDFRNGASSWFHRLSEIFKALSTSQISLHFHNITQVVPDDICGGVYQPLVIENLSLEGDLDSSVPDFLNCLLHSFRPRNIRQTWNGYNKLRENQLIELLHKILLLEREGLGTFGNKIWRM